MKKKDFSEVLDENPLPSSIEVAVKTEKYSNAWFGEFKKTIEARIPEVIEISTPTSLLDQIAEQHFFLSYKRQ